MEVHPRLELGFPRYDGGVLPLHQQTLVERMGLEPTALCLQSTCASVAPQPHWWTSRDSNSVPCVANALCYL